jgi:hypothetical protein
MAKLRPWHVATESYYSSGNLPRQRYYNRKRIKSNTKYRVSHSIKKHLLTLSPFCGFYSCFNAHRFWDPAGSLQLSAHRFVVPAHRFQVSAGYLKLSAHRFQLSTHRFQVPAHRFQVPAGCLQLSATRFQVPASRWPPPGSEVVGEKIIIMC